MKLWFYSSGDGEENAAIDVDLMAEITSRKPRFTFIPTGSREAEYFYDEFIERFGRYGYKNFNMLHLDRPFSTAELTRALHSDLIYISGGNTFNLLKHARESGFLRHLRRFVATGGVLAGHSAGAILMTPSIRTASFPDHDRDENIVGLTNWRAADFVNFEIFPHYLDLPEYSDALSFESEKTRNPIYALADGAGIAVHGERLSFYGEVVLFTQGRKVPITPP